MVQEAHDLAAGNVPKVVAAVLFPDGAKIRLPWQMAAPIDLAGRAVLEAVEVPVDPRVIALLQGNDGRQAAVILTEVLGPPLSQR